MTTTKLTRRAVLAGASAATLGACALPGGGDPPQLYTLTPKSTFAADLPRAASYMERAAKQDLLEAMIDFAVMLFNGQGTPKDETRAAALFRRAALRGNPLAMNRYARLLAAGRGTRPDAQKAAQWHMTAHMLGASDAWLQEFVKNMDPVQREAAESGARDWLR